MEVKRGEDGFVYIRVQKGKVARTVEPLPEIHVDLDAGGQVLGIEVCGTASADELLAVFQQFGLEMVPQVRGAA